MTRAHKENNNETEDNGSTMKPTSARAETINLASLPPEQRAIAERAASETSEWSPITEESMHDFSMAYEPTDLKTYFPEAWKEQVEKRYAFRWCERTDKRVDELTRGGSPITQWKLCTRTTTPFLERYIDPMWGGIIRGDQILLFRPWERHMIEKNAKFQLAERKADSGKPEKIATRRAGENIEAYSGPDYKIKGDDDVQYEDTRADENEFGSIDDLVVEE